MELTIMRHYKELLQDELDKGTSSRLATQIFDSNPHATFSKILKTFATIVDVFDGILIA